MTELNLCPFCRYDLDKTGHHHQCQSAIIVDPEVALKRAERKKQLEADKLKKFEKQKFKLGGSSNAKS